MAFGGALALCGLLGAVGMGAAPESTTVSAEPAATPIASPAPAPAIRGSVAAMAAPLVAAHRGGFFGPQGGLAGIGRTISDGDADIIEIDLRSTNDGRVVVYHDPLLQSKTTCKDAVADKSYRDIASCRLLHSGEPLPLFSQLLVAARGRAIVDAEFKTKATIAPAIEIVKSMDDMDGVYFQVGDRRDRYRLARALAADVNLQFKVTSDDDMAWALSRRDPYLRIIEMDRDFITPQRIGQAHAQGKLVSENTWRYQFTEERFGSSCTRAFTAAVDIAVTNNAASCSRQRRSHPYSAPHRWIYAVIGRPHVRQAARFIGSRARTTLLALRELVSAL